MNSRIKILHISKYYPPFQGGIEDVCYNIVNGLSGFDQKVLCFNDNPFNKFSLWDGVEVERAGIVKEIARQPISFSFYKLLKRNLKTYNPDIIHMHLPNPLACLYVLLLIPSSTRLILHWHSDIIVNKSIYRVFSYWEDKIIRRANSIIVTSPNYLEYSNPLREYKSKCVVIPNVVSLKKFEERGQMLEIDNMITNSCHKSRVFFMGRHVEYKGISYLLEAEKYIKNDCEILIAGSGPLTDLLKKQNVSSRVRFVGRISDEKAGVYMRSAQVFAFPSITKNEAFGVVLAEAMYYGAVPVTFEIKGSGVNWVSLKNVTGLEVENCNSKQFGEAIDELLINEQLREKLSKNARKRVLENFTMDIIKGKIEDLYNLIMQ